jgi:hypothetical protein
VPAQAIERTGIAEIGRRVRRPDRALRAADRRMPYQPEDRAATHLNVPEMSSRADTPSDSARWELM